MICTECGNCYFTAHIVDGVCPECYDMNKINDDEGLQQDFEDTYADTILEQQEMEDFDETDEAYGRYDSGDEYDDYTYDNDCDLWNES
jgi:hypothetical protein